MNTAISSTVSSINYRPVSWTALQYFNTYRILLAGLFVSLIHIGQLPRPLGLLDANLFSIVAHGYLVIAILFLAFIQMQVPRYYLQIAIHALVDIIVLSLMMYSSNGLSSGFGMLLVIAVAGGSILRAGKIAILFAAIATIAVLAHELYIQFFLFAYNVNYIHAGILGATFFVTAIIGNLLSARVRESEALAEKRAEEVSELAELNEHIVQRMQSGIVVLDNNLKPLLINASAGRLLKHKTTDNEDTVQQITSKLKIHIDKWLKDENLYKVIIKPDNSEIEVQASFVRLAYGSSYQILVFLEDIASIRQRAQEMKLASLGRLAASIAHEIRNPLGAINHAGQLLHESDKLSSEDQRLVEIINEHSTRVNSIIENVLSISKRGETAPERILLKPWLLKFADEVRSRYKFNTACIELDLQDEQLQINIDPIQLHQVLWNLCENGLRYSRGTPLLTIRSGTDRNYQRPYIDVIDYGAGIPENIRESLFEPFFTTETDGSGLGLYLAREICEANSANLLLLRSSDKGTTFRIIFMHVKKQV